VGIENLRLETAFAGETDENHGRSAVAFQRVTNGWMRQVTARFFWYGAVSVRSTSMYITVEDSAMLEHKSLVASSRRYSFYIDDSDFILFQRCLAKDGRHDFVSGSKTPGPNVFVDSTGIDAKSDSGPHHRFATGQLYDNINVRNISRGELFVRNRGAMGTGHGWSGAQVLFWNTNATIIADAPNGAMNYAIGNVGPLSSSVPKEPRGIIQSLNQTVVPRSLYYEQLKERMGIRALNTQVVPAQKEGTIWTLLELWFGNGLLLDPVATWYHDEGSPAVVGMSASPVRVGVYVAIGGRVRNLNLLENGPSFQWRLVSGPGKIEFRSRSTPETSVRFSKAGRYRLQLLVRDPNGSSASGFLSIVSSAICHLLWLWPVITRRSCQTP